MRELQPINQNVLLKLNDNKAEQKTASGIIIPDSAKEKENIGTVVAMGSIENAEIAVGDQVLFKDFSGSTFEFDGKNFQMIQYVDILAKVVATEAI
jgi:chaperonin GroES